MIFYTPSFNFNILLILIFVIISTTIYIFCNKTMITKNHILPSNATKEELDKFYISRILKRNELSGIIADEWKDLFKCQWIRIKRMQEICKEIKSDGYQQLHSYKEDEIKNMTYKFLTDDIHKLIMKAIPKTGCTSWKSLMVKEAINNIENATRTQINPHSWGTMREHAGLYMLSDYNKIGIVSKLQSYVTMLTVRHPFTRLESAFKDKIMHVMFTGNKIEYDNETVDRFKTFLMKIINGRFGNKHWNTYMSHAHPCIIPFNYIGKAETANMEMEFILKHILRGISNITQDNQSAQLKDDKKLTNGDRFLPLFSNIPNASSVIEGILKIYGIDMALFGYSYVKKSGGYYATCENYDFKGQCC